MSYIEKDILGYRVRHILLVSIKKDHFGPRGKFCIGGEMRIRLSDLSDYNKGVEIVGFCPGCGYQGPVARKRKD